MNARTRRKVSSSPAYHTLKATLKRSKKKKQAKRVSYTDTCPLGNPITPPQTATSARPPSD